MTTLTFHFLDTRDGKTPLNETRQATLIERDRNEITVRFDGDTEEYGYEKVNQVWWEINGEACARITYHELDSWELVL